MVSYCGVELVTSCACVAGMGGCRVHAYANTAGVLLAFLLFLAPLLASCASSGTPTAPPEPTPTRTPSPVVHLRNAHLSISISRTTGAILQVENVKSGLRLIRTAQELPPWRLYFFDLSTGEVEEWEEWEEFAITTGSLAQGGDWARLLWRLMPGLEIEARVELPAESPDAFLYVSVHNDSERTVQQLEFPVLRGIGRLVESPAEGNLLLHPVAGGFLFVDPFASFPRWAARGLRHVPYPEGIGAFTQFMAYYAQDVGGFYLACHDPLNTAKEVDFFWSTHGLEALFTHKSWDMRAGNSLLLEYPIVLGALEEGNWYEAAERYRRWATATGEGHPDWCEAGRLEDRVREGKAAKWLAEEVGFCTFGLPSSFDVSPWLEAFHRIADKPVFHVLGHDWPQWGGATVERMERLNALFQELGLKPFYEYSLNELWLAVISLPLDSLNTLEGQKRFFEILGARPSHRPAEKWREAFEEFNRCGPWLPPDVPPFPWFPTRFHPANLETIRRNGDRFAPFFFDFFAYGHDVGKYGLNRGAPTGWQLPTELVQAGFAKIWMDPCTPFWQEFHAQRDGQLVAESGADGLYYDISAGCGPRWSDRDDHGHPRGYGRWLWDCYAEVYRRSKEAAMAAKGRYVAQGTEMGIENLIRYVDFCQWRAGGLVQGDIEVIPFLPLLKEGKALKVPLFSFLYHEYGPVMMDGWAKLSREFGEIFYLIAAQVALQQGGLLQLNYEYSPLERFPGMEGPTYQLVYHCAIWEERDPYEVDPEKLEFLREIALARTEFAKEYLAYGKALRPVRFLSPVPQMHFSWKHYNSIGGRRESGRYPAPSIVHQAWSYRDEKLGLLFVNLDGTRTQEVEFAVDRSKYGLKDGPLSLWRVTSEGREEIGRWEGGETLRLSVQLPPRRIILIEIIPASA